MRSHHLRSTEKENPVLMSPSWRDAIIFVPIALSHLQGEGKSTGQSGTFSRKSDNYPRRGISKSSSSARMLTRIEIQRRDFPSSTFWKKSTVSKESSGSGF